MAEKEHEPIVGRCSNCDRITDTLPCPYCSVSTETAPAGQHWRFPGGPIDLPEDGMETCGQPPWIERAIFAAMVLVVIAFVAVMVYA